MIRENRHGRFSVLNIELPRALEILMSMGIMGLLIVAVYAVNIPNPNMILITGLVVCSAVFGYAGGITTGIIMFLYTLFFFSTGNDFVTFTVVNMQKVVVSLFGIVADLVFVCELKKNEAIAFQEIRTLTEKLSEENYMLQTASSVDALTGARNRYGLRRDYASYQSKSVYVVMMDIDDFKNINDTHGHQIGDELLAATGRLLIRLFGQEHCYRYGGDEFLLILPGMEEAEFAEKAATLIQQRPSFEVDGHAICPGFSVGYVRGFVQGEDMLREMFASADYNMYAAKRRGKNQIVGSPATGSHFIPR